ncbi:gfo/Idh/MocA family oxidoreductase [Acidimicrobiaceae bacterium USS-CC1]|uniref:Gfo/Idh/MocA family oxidoreductase n=1 Tax=Acidiferrimicrobium australe TaxID=2664430 RepID=A0ABW9QY71_9ACTN|nr:gfo/Idh/MocA family oxidoreductase [Acidiferrimicrobium australe]
MSRRLGVGLLGVGWMGALHTRAYRRLTDHYPELDVRCELVAAADVGESGRRRAVEELGYARAEPDWRAVVDDPDVDVVSVTAPNALHREMALAVLAAGKALWVEKPVGRGLAETAAVAAALGPGAVTAVGFNYRTVPLVEHAGALVAAGALGRITGFRGWFLNDYASNPWGPLNWRFSRDGAGSGALGDLMSHVVDLATALLGPLREVVAVTDVAIARRPYAAGEGEHFATLGPGALEPPGDDVPTGEVENEDSARVLARFASGASGFLEVDRAAVGPHCSLGFEIHGSTGSLSWDFERMNELQLYLADTTGDAGYRRVLARPGHGDYGRFQPGPAISMSYDDLKVIEAARFVGAVLTGDPLAPGLAEALSAARAVDAMERSAASRAWEAVA